MIKNCRICGKEFETGRGNTQTCSTRCKRLLHLQTREIHYQMKKATMNNGKGRTGNPVGRPRKEPVVTTKQPNESNTLCWSCQNACGGCSWSKKLKPVRGWKADKLKIKHHNDKDKPVYTDSYFVRECPKYIMDE